MKKVVAIILSLVLVCTCVSAMADTFRVGVKQDVYGFGYLDETTGEYTGMEIELGALIAEALGYDEVEYTTVTAATRGQMLDNDELDCVIATFTIKPERKESWDFSTPYYTDAVTVLVQTDSGIVDLTGLVDAFDVDSFDISTFNGGVSFKQYDEYPAISIALSAGDVDAFCVDKSILANYKTADRSFIADSFSPQDYGVATKKGSELSVKVEELVTGWLEDGTIDALIAEWGL